VLGAIFIAVTLFLPQGIVGLFVRKAKAAPQPVEQPEPEIVVEALAADDKVPSQA
jgi:hypothetical protein